MKRIILILLGCVGLTVNAFAADSFVGISPDTVLSSHDEANNSLSGFTSLLSIRQIKHYGLELKEGIFGKAGLFSSNGKTDTNAVGNVAKVDTSFKLYDKSDAANDVSDVSLSSSGENVNNLSLTYDTGVDYQHSNGAVRLGLQHFYVGNKMLSPSLSSNMIGVSFLVK